MIIENILPPASTSDLGISAVDEEDFEISADGTVSVAVPPYSLVSQSSGTDDEITAMINAYYDGNYTLEDVQSVQTVGDCRDITIGAITTSGTANGFTQSVGESHHQQTQAFEILDFNHDDLTTPIGSITKALITVDQKECLRHEGCSDTGGSQNTERGYMNSSQTNIGGQSTCARRNQCNGGYYAALPNYIKSLIKPVNKLTSAGNKSSTINITSDYCFLLSCKEGNSKSTSQSVSGEGIEYIQYINSTSNINKLPRQSSDSSHVSSAYWGRSPYKDSSVNFLPNVTYTSISYTQATGNFGLAPAFCL